MCTFFAYFFLGVGALVMLAVIVTVLMEWDLKRRSRL